MSKKNAVQRVNEPDAVTDGPGTDLPEPALLQPSEPLLLNASCTQVGNLSVIERVIHRSRLRERLQAARPTYSQDGSKLGVLKNELLCARNDLRDYLDREGRNESEKALYKEKRNNGQARVKKIEQQIADAEKNFSALGDEVASLKRELQLSNSGGAMLDDVLAYQAALDQSQSKADQISVLIEEQNHAIAGIAARMPTQSALYARREDLAADIALGKAIEVDLNKLDKEIAREEQESEHLRTELLAHGKRAHQVIAGLRRQQVIADRELAALKEMGKEIYSMFLQSLAEGEAAEYMKHACSLRDSYMQLAAIDRALAGVLQLLHRQSSEVLGVSGRAFNIPFFPILKTCEHHDGIAESTTTFFSGENLNKEALAKEFLDQLRKKGV